MWYLGEKTHWNIVARLKAHLMEVIRCYYPSYTVIANISKYIQIYPNISNYLQIYPTISKYIQIYPNISKYIQLSPNISKYIQIYPNISNYLQIYPTISKYIQIYPTISKYIYIYIQIYPNISHNPNCTPKYVHYHVLYILPTAAPVARSFHRPTPMTTRRGSCRPCSDAMLCQYDEDLARIWSLKKKQIS